MPVQTTEEYPPPVKLEQVIILSQDDAEAPSVFGDDDALLSVISEAFEVKRSDKSTMGGSDASKTSTDKLKSSELRSTGKDDHSFLSERWGTSTKIDMKLNLDCNQLIARDKEISILKDCFHRLMKKRTNSPLLKLQMIRRNKELVFLNGQSGVGKSSVVMTLEEDVVKLDDCLFVTGKFDMNTSDKPYSGISDALHKAFQKVQEGAESDSISNAIKAEVAGDEMQLLSHLIPSLKVMLGEFKTTKTPADPDFDELENGLERLKIAFRALIRVLCQEFALFAIFLDDLQWADTLSLQVLDSLISDRQNENKLMVVGAYRSDEVDENSLLYNKILALHEKKDDCEFSITEMELRPFGAGDIHQIIKIATKSSDSDDRMQPLAKLCLKRTLGNPFFVIEFLKMIETEGLLTYDTALHRWNWDLSTIEDSTMSTANVVVLLQQRIRKMPKHVQLVLQLAAYLGSSFKEASLGIIWSTYGTVMALGKKEPLPKLLNQIVDENFLEKCGVNSMRWVHDKVQEAALYLNRNLLQSLQFNIGSTLYYCLKPEELNDDLFNVVDLINNGNLKKRREFADLNMKAAEKSRGMSAYQSAARYATHAMELLTENLWTENRPLTLKIYIMAAEMELILGNIDVADKYIEDILKHGNFSIMETFPLKLSKAKALGVTLNFDDALDYSLSVLKELGCNLVLSRRLVLAHAPIKLLRTISKVKKVKDDFYVGMETMSDPKQRAIASTVICIKYAAYNSGDMMLVFLCVCKLVEITMKHGLSEFSGCAFALLGSCVVIVQHDYKVASRILNMASSIQEAFGKTRTSQLMFNAHLFGWMWIRPLQTSTDPLREAYTMAVRLGEIDYAMWSAITTTLSIPYASGDSLGPIMAECPKLLAQAEDMQRSAQILHVRVFWQMMLNIQSGSTKLEGKVFSKANDDNHSRLHLANVHLAEGGLLFFHGDFEAAAERAISTGDLYSENAPSIFLIMGETFNRGVALYAMARKHKKRAYKKQANSIRKQVAKWVKAGNPNVEHFHLLLRAEHEALEKKYDNADESYRRAITVATTGGYLPYIALFNERYADFLLNLRSSKEESVHRTKEAARYFEEWGALARAQALRKNLI